jgi:hypothetical protein
MKYKSKSTFDAVAKRSDCNIPRKRKELGLQKKKRLLMARYTENPVNARLALEIASLNRDLAILRRG